jgi:hypothetical protein
MRRILYRTTIWLVCATGLASTAADILAQSEAPKSRTVEMVLRPASQPDPAMKFRLLTDFPNREPGDAAQYYYRALGLLPVQNSETNWENITRWLVTNLAALPESEVANALAPLKSAMKETATAGLRETCHWDMPLKDGMGMLLPGLGNFKKLAQGLALQCRMQVAGRQWDAALKSLSAGFALSHNVAKGPTLIQGLVGIAMGQIMLNQVETIVQQPDAPNLYWALSALPRPYVDLRRSMEWENQFLFIQFPQLREIEKTPMSTHEARKLMARLMTVWTSGPEELVEPRAEDVMYVLAVYPQAKQALLGQGFSAETLDSFPSAQVALIHTTRVFQHYSQDLLKWFYVPYHQAFENMRSLEKQWELERGAGLNRNLVAMPVLMMLPALTRTYSKAALLERNIDALRCIEAIRLHASLNSGKLPESLQAITTVPVPIDPMTGKEFLYKIEAGKAILEGLVPPGEPVRSGFKYIITMNPSSN